MKALSCTLGLLAAIIFLSSDAGATELMTNGGFETGNFTGWTVTNATNPWINWTNSPAGATGGATPGPTPTTPQEGSRDAWNGVAQNAGSAFTLSQDIVLPAGRIARLTWKDRFQMDLFSFCSTLANCGTATYTVQVLNTSNVVLQTLYTVNAPGLAITDTGWVSHNVGLTAFQGQTIRLRFLDTVTVTWAGPGQAEIDAVSLQSLIPTAAYVSLSGRVVSADGRGIGGIGVSLTGGNSEPRYALTNPFGYYRFDDVLTGETYVVAVGSKRYTFIDSPRVVTVNDDLAGVDFMAGP